MMYSTSRGSAAVEDDVVGGHDVLEPFVAQHFQQPRPLLAAVQIDLVEHQQNGLVDGGQRRQGRELGLVQVGIGHKQDQIRTFRGFAGHQAAVRPAHFVQARRVHQHDLGLSQPRHAIAAAVPGDVPDFLGPASADVHRRDGLADQGVDQRRLARADFPKDDDFDAAFGQLAEHLLQLVPVAVQMLLLGVRTAAEPVQRALDGRDRLAVVVFGLNRCFVHGLTVLPFRPDTLFIGDFRASLPATRQ